jgi:hypothetical protein
MRNGSSRLSSDNMDRRHKRTERTRGAIVAAIERLQKGDGTHARHVGLRIRITKQAIAREAGISSATLCRYPDLVARIGAVAGDAVKQRLKPSEQRRARMVDDIAQRDREIAALLSENFRLTRELAKYDPHLGATPPANLERKRAERRK